MFPGQERDGGTATLDYFDARHFSAVLGSMTQPDPMNAGGDILNPQSWNAYAYVLGNPLGLVDPGGMDPQCGPGGTWSGEGCQGGTTSGGFGGNDGYSGITEGNCFSAASSAPCGGFPGAGGGYGGVSSSVYIGLPASGSRVAISGAASALQISGSVGMALDNSPVFSFCPMASPTCSSSPDIADVFGEILSLARYGPWGGVAAILFQPTPMTPERAWEIQNKRRATGKRSKLSSGWIATRKVTEALREECEEYPHARSNKNGNRAYGAQWVKDYAACIEAGGIENMHL